MTISREKFFHAINNGGFPRQKVDLPDGEEIYVRKMTLGEQNRMYTMDEGRRQAFIICVCACLEDGEPFFQQKDMDAIERMPAEYVNPIWLAARGITPDEEPEGNETTSETSS